MLHAVLSWGTNWSTIAASHTPKRATLALKNRYSTLRLRNQSARNQTAPKSTSPPAILPIVDKTTNQKNIQEDVLVANKTIAGDEENDEDDENEEEGGDEDEYECSPSSMLCNKLRPSTLNSSPPTTNFFSDPTTTSNTASVSDLWTSFNESNDLLVFPTEPFGNKDSSSAGWMSDLNDLDLVAVDQATIPGCPKESHMVYTNHGFTESNVSSQDAGGPEMDLDLSFAQGKSTSLLPK